MKSIIQKLRGGPFDGLEFEWDGVKKRKRFYIANPVFKVEFADYEKSGDDWWYVKPETQKS